MNTQIEKFKKSLKKLLNIKRKFKKKVLTHISSKQFWFCQNLPYNHIPIHKLISLSTNSQTVAAI